MLIEIVVYRQDGDGLIFENVGRINLARRSLVLATLISGLQGDYLAIPWTMTSQHGLQASVSKQRPRAAGMTSLRASLITWRNRGQRQPQRISQERPDVEICLVVLAHLIYIDIIEEYTGKFELLPFI